VGYVAVPRPKCSSSDFNALRHVRFLCAVSEVQEENGQCTLKFKSRSPTTLGTSSTSNIEILERFQSKTLRMIVDALWYVSNTVIQRDLQITTVKEEIQRYSSQYSANLIANLMELPDNMRLRRQLPNELPTKFLV
jgi:hypothetical protein